MGLDSFLGTSNESNSRLHVTGTAYISGNLNIFSGDGVDPTTYAADDSFTVLTADGGLYGQFSNLPAGYYDNTMREITGLPLLASGLEWHVDYTSTSVTLEVLTAASTLTTPVFYADGDVTVTRDGNMVIVRDTFNNEMDLDATRYGPVTINTGNDSLTITLDQTSGAIGFRNTTGAPIVISGTGYDTLVVSGGSLTARSDMYNLGQLNIMTINDGYLDLIGDQQLNSLSHDKMTFEPYLNYATDTPPGYGLSTNTSLSLSGNLVVRTMNDVDPGMFSQADSWTIVAHRAFPGRSPTCPKASTPATRISRNLAAGLSWLVDYTSTDVTVTVVPHPYVVSIARAGSDETTNATSVNYTVTFSEAVTGVDATDFALLSDGVDSATIGTPTTSDNITWTVPVATGTGAGTLELDLVDNDSITDSGGVTLGSDYTDDGSFTGEAYTLVDTLYWYDTTDDWSSGNWKPAADGSGTSLAWTDRTQFAVFPDLLGGTITVSGTITLAGLDIEGAGYTFTGGTLNLTGDATLTINADTSIASTLTGSAGLTKEGSATLTLTGTNTYTGTTTLNDGTLGDGRLQRPGRFHQWPHRRRLRHLRPKAYDLTHRRPRRRWHDHLTLRDAAELQVGMNDADGSFTGVIADGIGTDGTIWPPKDRRGRPHPLRRQHLLQFNRSGRGHPAGDQHLRLRHRHRRRHLSDGTLGGCGIIAGTVTADSATTPSPPVPPSPPDTTTTLTLGGLTTRFRHHPEVQPGFAHQQRCQQQRRDRHQQLRRLEPDHSPASGHQRPRLRRQFPGLLQGHPVQRHHHRPRRSGPDLPNGGQLYRVCDIHSRRRQRIH